VKFQTSRRDLLVSVAFVLGLGLWMGYGFWDKASKRAELETVSRVQASAHLEGLEKDEFDVIEELISDKSFVFFGNDFGVLRLYIRKAEDTSMDSFIGIEYFYEYGDDGWVLRDTAQIRQPEFIYEGYRSFESHGFEVSPQAYERYNR